eukprot:TRINITY_DN6820_c0_g1_i2.p1 TRINITY_DN6820_c0_g1~~TRINITY_DN6820_c0_g1_i2.p1  ORF type:complete len:378 (-),score=163.08 TRINITY_DN6820_c0_g1_i2:303-1436(-)
MEISERDDATKKVMSESKRLRKRERRKLASRVFSEIMEGKKIDHTNVFEVKRQLDELSRIEVEDRSMNWKIRTKRVALNVFNFTYWTLYLAFLPLIAVYDVFFALITIPLAIARETIHFILGSSSVTRANEESNQCLQLRVRVLEKQLYLLEKKLEALSNGGVSFSAVHLPSIQVASEETFESSSVPPPPAPAPPPPPPIASLLPKPLNLSKKTSESTGEAKTPVRKSFSITLDDIRSIRLKKAQPLSFTDVTKNQQPPPSRLHRSIKSPTSSSSSMRSPSRPASTPRSIALITSPTRITQQARLLRKINKSPGGTPSKAGASKENATSPNGTNIREQNENHAALSPYRALQKRMFPSSPLANSENEVNHISPSRMR